MKLILCLLFGVISAIAVPLEPKVLEYRLPEDLIQVQSYNIELNLKSDIFESNVFSGTVTIVFETKKITKEIKLHANQIKFNDVKLEHEADDGTKNVVPLTNEKFESDTITDILTLTTENDLSIGKYTLTLIYEGKLRTNEMYGFYKSTYVKSDGSVQALGTTQFQPTHARKAFPCFDEPGYKAEFNIKIKHPAKYKAWSNTAGTPIQDPANSNFAITTFATTPKMSTYLIAFIVSDFTCSRSSTDIETNVPHYLCSRNETEANRALGLDVGPKLVNALQNFTDIKYSESKIDKMHQFAIPDFSAGAMENWGLITYRETGSLWDPKESSNLYKQRTENVFAHEIAHMWFGNLVTTHWWSDTFLNEGFARYFQYFGTALVETHWELDKQFVVEQVQSMLANDAQPSALPLSWNVSSPAEVSGRFGSVSYNKGASVLRMLKYLLGENNFQVGIRKYLKDHTFGTTTPADLWSVFTPVQSIGKTVAEIMENWITKPGFPLISVTSNGKDISITQKRFLVSGTDDGTKWIVPLTYTLSSDTNGFDNLATKTFLLNEPLIVTNVLEDNDSWIILNNQQIGFYRVEYDSALLSRIKKVLETDNSKIHVLNKAQLVDDIYNLAKVGKSPYQEVFDFFNYLKNEKSYFPWYSAFTAFSGMLQRTANEIIRKSLSDHILGLMETLLNDVPFEQAKDDDQIYTLNRVQANTWACRLGHNACITKAIDEFKKYKETKTKPDKNMKVIIYCNGLRHSEDPKSDWDFLWNEFNSTSLATEEATLISALGCSKDKDVLTEYLHYSISNSSGIRQQDALSVFSTVYSQNPEGVDIAFDFLLENYKLISEYYGSMNSLSNLFSGLAARFTRAEQIDRLRTFLENTEDLTESLKLSGQAALTNAEANLKWTEEFEKQLRDYFKISGNGGSSTNVSFITIVTILALSFLFQ